MSDLLSARRLLSLSRESRFNASFCKITTEFTAVLKIDVLIFSFYLNSRSLLRRTINKERVLLLKFTVKLTFNVLNLFSLLNNRLFLRKVTLTNNNDDIVVLKP